ncbi:TPA: hypothetical protein DDW35_08045 [Candidatus Sumerlaeota bacterium]|jgi:hypothetical protein|nr:hypothetical protein [Candidatus Sumerlaeota bacterium]
MEQDPHLIDLPDVEPEIYKLAVSPSDCAAEDDASEAWTEVFQNGNGYTCDGSIPGVLVCIHSEHAHWPLVVRSVEDLKWNLFVPISDGNGANNAVPTTVLYQGKAWRVDEIFHSNRFAWIYRLHAWPEAEPWFKVFELTHAAIKQVGVAEKQLRKRHRQEQCAWLYEPFIGFLPSHIQMGLARWLNFDPEQASRKNALLHFYVFFGLMMAGATDLVSVMLGAMPLVTARYVFVLLGFALEGLFRWAHVCASTEPCGFVVTEVFDWITVQVLFISKNFHRYS